MRARGVLSLHTAPISVPKTPASKSCACLTSKLIETEGLQVLHSGHLRKTGGRGSYQFAKGYPARPSTLRATEHGPQFFYHSPACPERGRRLHPERRRRACPPKLQRRRIVFPPYAKTAGVYPTQKYRRDHNLDFSPHNSHFLALSATRIGGTPP